MDGRTNAYGGGKAFAAISVTYPEGSALSCTDGKKTLKARSTGGLWLFLVPYAAVWTVSITDPSGENEPESQDVLITTEGQSVSVTLRYGWYVFREGVGLAPEFTVYTKGPYTVFGTDAITNSGEKGFVLQPAISGGGHTKLMFEISVTAYNGTATYAPTLGLSSSLGLPTDSVYTGSDFLAKTAVTRLTEREICSVDISGVTQDAYIKLTCYYSAWKIHNIWLE